MKKITIKDVAKDAGVSLAIASFALNNVQGRVSKEVREKVLASSKRLGYVPNAFARSLRGVRSDTIALIYDEEHLEERNSSTLQFVANTIKYAKKKSKDILVKLIGDRVDWNTATQEFIQLSASQKVEGIIFHCDLPGEDFLSAMEKNNVNYVHIPQINERMDGFNSVSVNHKQMMLSGLDFISEKGYGEIYYLTQKKENQNIREKAYSTFMEQKCLKGSPLYYYSGYRGKGEIWEAIKHAVENRAEKMAIACWNDVDAMNVIDILHSKGIKIPEEIGVMGFDDIPGSEYTVPALTTIRQPFDEIARLALDIILEQKKEKGNSNVSKSISVSGSIIERESI